MGQDFIDRRQGNWQRLEEVLSIVTRKKLCSLNRNQVREFGHLYQRTAADFAIARQEIRDTKLVNYLNNLVGQAHGVIYRVKGSGFRGIWKFYRYSAPALFRETYRYTLAAFLVFLFFGTFSGVMVAFSDDFARIIDPATFELVKNKQNWTEFINSNNPAASSFIMTNNVKVAIYAFATGIFGGIGTLYFMAQNGLQIGGVTAICIKYNFTPVLIFMSGHGVFELMAIFISGGAGFLMGGALLVPRDKTRLEALIERGAKSIKLLMICFPMLVIAGIIEGFISPAYIPAHYKLTLSFSTAILLVLYFSISNKNAENIDLAL